jgi:photoactive yellow protein
MSIAATTEIREFGKMSQSQLDALGFGVIQVDDSGTVKSYNKYESELGNTPIAEAIGKNFFTQVAPCTNNRLIFGKFKDGVAANNMDLEVGFVFTYKIKPVSVTIQMFRDTLAKTNWILVKRR